MMREGNVAPVEVRAGEDESDRRLGPRRCHAGQGQRKRWRRRGRRGRLLTAAGALCVAAAIALGIYNVWDTWHAGSVASEALSEFELATPLSDSLPGIDSLRPMPEVEIDGRSYIGKLVIPSQGLELPVQASWDYPALRVSPCRYAGSAYSGDLVIAAHNYVSHFGGLKGLREGDEVRFVDADGNEFSYAVAFTDVLGPTAVDEMKAADGWDLTLFTCTWGGASRVTVRCANTDGPLNGMR